MKFFILIILVVSLYYCEATDSVFKLDSVFLYHREQKALFRHSPEEHRRSEHAVFGELKSLSSAQFLGKQRALQGNKVRGDDQDNGDDDSSWFSALSPLPDVYDRNTVSLLAALASNAYEARGSSDWIEVPGIGESEYAEPFGWDLGNTLRGYVFSNLYNQVIVAFKGTDIPVWTDTGSNDVYEDFLMFSCCAEPSNFHEGCGCDRHVPGGSHRRVCNVHCVVDCLIEHRTSYFDMALQVFASVKQEYHESAEYYFTGHSLGGAIASLMSAATNYPAVTFETPPDWNYAWLSSLNVSGEANAHLPIFQFGNNRDSIFVGGSECIACSMTGSPIKTKCHVGYTCVWDLSDVGVPLSPVYFHHMSTVIQVIDNESRELPTCIAETACIDCEEWLWEFPLH